MVVSMGRGVGDGKVVDGGAISSTMIFDMVTSKRDDIEDGRMTSNVVVSDAITSDILASRRKDTSDDGEVTLLLFIAFYGILFWLFLSPFFGHPRVS